MRSELETRAAPQVKVHVTLPISPRTCISLEVHTLPISSSWEEYSLVKCCQKSWRRLQKFLNTWSTICATNTWPGKWIKMWLPLSEVTRLPGCYVPESWRQTAQGTISHSWGPNECETSFEVHWHCNDGERKWHLQTLLPSGKIQRWLYLVSPRLLKTLGRIAQAYITGYPLLKPDS